MESSIKIRKFEFFDAEKCAKLNALVWQDAYKHIFPEQVFVNQQKNIDKKTQMFQNGINDKNILTYVAEVDGEIVGYISGSLVSQYEYFSDREFADLLAIYINPEYQGKGIATKFKQIFVDWLRTNGKTKFVVGVLEKNNKARVVYEKWGGNICDYRQSFQMLDQNYTEVFYTYTI